MKKTFLTSALVGVACLLAACAGGTFDERRVIPEARWDREQPVSFDVSVDDTAATYTFGIALRHMENYRYSNLYVFMNTTLPNGTRMRDTIEMTLALPDGHWVGKGSGSMRDVRQVLIPNLRFPLRGAYRFDIEQAMREPVLGGVADIGLFIEKQ